MLQPLISTFVKSSMIFTSAVGKIDLAHRAGLGHVRSLKDNGDGFATYEIDLAAKQQAKRRRSP